MRTLLIGVVLWLTACAAEPPVPPAPAVPARDTSVRQQPAPDVAAEPVAAVEAQPAPDPASLGVRLTALPPGPADDGRGGIIDVQSPVQVDLQSSGWPGEAMDPSLTVGDARFSHYSHPDPVTLRFVVARAELVPPGSRGVVRYGERVVAELVLPQVQTP